MLALEDYWLQERKRRTRASQLASSGGILGQDSERPEILTLPVAAGPYGLQGCQDVLVLGAPVGTRLRCTGERRGHLCPVTPQAESSKQVTSLTSGPSWVNSE